MEDRVSFLGEQLIRNNSGQSTIEFIMSFAIVLGFLFSFYKLALIYTNGYLVHYATYMASRSYMVVDINSSVPDGSDGIALERAQGVFDRFRLTTLINDFNGKLKANDPESFNRPENNMYVGIFAEFEETLMTPLFGKSRGLNLRSDSYLGREPTRSECFFRICRAMGEVSGEADYCGIHSTVFDNGC